MPRHCGIALLSARERRDLPLPSPLWVWGGGGAGLSPPSPPSQVTSFVLGPSFPAQPCQVVRRKGGIENRGRSPIQGDRRGDGTCCNRQRPLDAVGEREWGGCSPALPSPTAYPAKQVQWASTAKQPTSCQVVPCSAGIGGGQGGAVPKRGRQFADGPVQACEGGEGVLSTSQNR